MVDEATGGWRHLTGDAGDQRSVTPVLWLTLAVMVAAPFLAESARGRALTTVMIGVTAVVALRRAGARASLRHYGVAVVVVFAVAGALGQSLAEGDGARAAEVVGASLLAVLLLVTPFVVVLRLLARPRVTLDTVAGALAAYLQIGLFFGVLFRLVDLIADEPFFAQTANPDAFDFTYFSFTTITTTGYGDLSAAQPVGQSLANLEAVLGQVFLVTVVALVVSNLGRAIPRRRAADGPGRGDRDAGTASTPPPG